MIKPMMPAITLLWNASTPMVAVCDEEEISCSGTGREPPRINAARLAASSWLKLPSMMQDEPVMTFLAVG